MTDPKKLIPTELIRKARLEQNEKWFKKENRKQRRKFRRRYIRQLEKDFHEAISDDADLDWRDF